MKNKNLFRLFTAAAALSIFISACNSPRTEDTVSQVSTIDALLAGVYDGEVTLKQLLAMGNTGIGTFDCLDGEMVVLDGKVYQVRADGMVRTPSLDTTTPFATVINFKADAAVRTEKDMDYPALQKMLDRISPGKNLFYVFRIKGRFANMKTRSVPRQKKPFPPLVEVVKNQPVFMMKNVSGTIVGFRCPAYVKGINVTGYHLHFISGDHKQGGHILQFKMLKGAYVETDCSNKFFMVLPESGRSFNKADLKIDRSTELHKVVK